MSHTKDFGVSKQTRRTGALRQTDKYSTNGIENQSVSEFTQIALADEQLLSKNEPKIVMMLDQEGTIILIEGPQADSFGLKRYELVGNSIHDADSRKPLILKTISNAVLKGNRTVIFTFKSTLFQIFIMPIWRGNREISGQLITVSEIPEKMDFEKMISSQSSLYRTLFDNLLDAVVIMDADEKIISVNKSFEDLFGYPVGEVRGKKIDDFLVPANLIEESSDITFIVNHGETAELETFRNRKDSRRIDVSVTASRILTDKKELYYIQIFRDITNRKRQEELVKATQLEKEILLKEVHHRIKKCIQIISSMLGLQATHTVNKNAAGVLSEFQNRLKSFSLIHENLYHTTDLSRIDFDRYIKSLIPFLTKSFGTKTDKIKISVEAENIFLNLDTAIPCGLIINELVTNSLKHAFPDNREGEIRIGLEYHHNNKLTLTVCDNGIGINNGDERNIGNTSGLQIIKTLVKQIEGKMSFKNGNGTEYKITFSIIDDLEK